MTGLESGATSSFLYIGRRPIGFITPRGRRWVAFAEPDCRRLGQFPSAKVACRAVYDADVQRRLAAAAGAGKGASDG